MSIHVALVSAYPTEAKARAHIAEELHVIALGQFRGCPYLGVWRMTEPHRTAVHVFADNTAAELEAIGWTKEDEA